MRAPDADPKIALFSLHTLALWRVPRDGRLVGEEMLLADRLSRKATGRHGIAGMVQHYNHSENLAADSLQIQPAEMIGSIYGCGNRGCGLLPAKSRTTSGANSAIIG
jgi:hypothetical protein